MNRQVYEEASEWLVELRVGDIDGPSRVRFDAWLRTSPEHIRAFLELSSIWEEGTNPEVARAHSTEELIARARAAPVNVVPLGAPTPEPAPIMPAHRKRLPLALAASLGLAALMAWAVYSYWNPTYATGTGEQRTVVLADGSSVELNARSRIRVRFSSSERDVDLITGQALFRVAKNPARPFVVQSEATRVRAVGTEFDVYRKSSGTTVTVLEGRVAVLPTQPPSADTPSTGAVTADSTTVTAQATILVSAGEQVTVTPSNIGSPAHADVAAATAWTRKELVFDGATLYDVAQEFNRYNVKQLIVSDAALKDFHVTGVFSSTNPASLLMFLKAQKGIHVQETPEGIRISRE